MSPDFKYEVESKVAAFAATADSTKSTVVVDIIKMVFDIAKTHFDLDAEKMAEFVGELYDKYIKPLDMPGVSEPFESMLDNVLKETLVLGVKKALQSAGAQ